MPFNGLHARLRPRRLLGARAKDKDYPMADATNGMHFKPEYTEAQLQGAKQ